MSRPSYEELCAAIEELLAARELDRQALHDDWTSGDGRFADEDDRREIEKMDEELARYGALLGRARRG